MGWGSKEAPPPSPRQERVHKCRFCGDSATDEDVALRHIRDHHTCGLCKLEVHYPSDHKAQCSQRKVKCDICSQQMRAHALDSHRQSHYCSNCESITKHPADRCHTVWCSKHKSKLPCAACEEVLCGTCKGTFANQACLDQHVEKDHTCQHCRGVHEGLEDHIKDCGEKPESCEICGHLGKLKEAPEHLESHRCRNCKEIVGHHPGRCPIVYCDLHTCEKPCVKCNFPLPEYLAPYHGGKAFNVCVTGQSGVGKSTFLNEFIDAKAKTGHTETTMFATRFDLKLEGHVEDFLAKAPYMHENCIRSHFKHVNVWDLPGHGTSNFECSRYIAEMGHRYYDFVVLLVGRSVMKQDVDLVKFLREADPPVKCIVARTRMDETLNETFDDLEKDLGRDASHEELQAAASDKLAEVRSYTQQQFENLVPVYLVASQHVISKKNGWRDQILPFLETSLFFEKLLLDIIRARAGHSHLHKCYANNINADTVPGEPRRQFLLEMLLRQ